MAIQNKSDIQTTLKLQAKEKTMETAKTKVQEVATLASSARADAQKAKKERQLAQKEAQKEEQKRLSLMK